MISAITNMFAIITAVLIGGVIGAGFGMVQEAARRRYERKQAEGKLKGASPVMLGSGFRVAVLLVTLLLVQIVCPILFRDGIQWWVSGGLVLGYGYRLYRELRRRMAENDK